jgi:hypothetical protein
MCTIQVLMVNSQRARVLRMKIYVRSRVVIYLLIVYSISGLQTFPELHYIYGPEDSEKDGFEYTCLQLCVCVCVCMYVCMYICIFL